MLINSGSASASEIVAGALKDHQRAVLLWYPVIWKRVSSVGHSSIRHRAIRLTTARYYTPSGVSIQATGITPNIEVALARIEKLDGGNTREENLKGALDKDVSEPNTSSPDSDPIAKSTREEVDQSKIDYQLARALDLIQGVAIFTFKEKSTP